MTIENLTRKTTIAQTTQVADTFVGRMRGLLNRDGLDKGEALVLTKCRSIHMLFMRFSIDVIFADKNDRVVGLVHNIKPFRLSRIFFTASYAIELPAGTIKETRTQTGDQLKLHKTV